MQLRIYAGPIFSTEQVLLFSVVFLLLIGIVLGLIAFFITKFFTKKDVRVKKLLLKSTAGGIFIVFVAVLVLGIIPTIIEDNAWNRKQEDCAKQVGYNSPAENNSNEATSYSQSAYKTCIKDK